MKLQNAWSRRSFLSAMAVTGAAAATVGIKLQSRKSANRASATNNHFAFLGTAATDDAATHSVSSYRIQNGKWELASTISAENPQALALHPALPVLYVAHSSDMFESLPRGSVSAFAIDPAIGALSLMGREAMALSATRPSHMAVSPDGRSLVVSSHGGGSYNLFSLAADGSLVSTPSPLKETGDAQGIAHPQSVAFRTDGAAAYTADLGTDRVSHLTFGNDGMVVRSRVKLAAGSGAAEVELHPSGRVLMVSSRLQPAISVVHVDKSTGELQKISHHYPVAAEAGGPIALNPKGNRLYAASTRSGETILTTYGVAGASGRLHNLQQLAINGVGRPVELMHLGQQTLGEQALLAGEKGIASLSFDPQTGMLNHSETVVAKPGVVSLAVLSL